MNAEVLSQIVERARTDPAFFHKLVFDPDRAIQNMPELNRLSKSLLVSSSPHATVARLLGYDCGRTCTVTCSMSCDTTQGIRFEQASWPQRFSRWMRCRE